MSVIRPCRSSYCILAAAGLLCLLISAYTTVTTVGFLTRSVRVVGVVRPSPRGAYHPVVSVTMLTGHTVLRELGGTTSHLPDTKVNVLYDPCDPRLMQLDTGADIWLLPAGAFLTGIVIAAAAAAGLRENNPTVGATGSTGCTPGDAAHASNERSLTGDIRLTCHQPAPREPARAAPVRCVQT